MTLIIGQTPVPDVLSPHVQCTVIDAYSTSTLVSRMAGNWKDRAAATSLSVKPA
jgi:hypothetical protein